MIIVRSAQVAIWTPAKSENSKFTLEACPKWPSLRSIFKIKSKRKKSSKFALLVSRNLKRNLIITDRENVQKLANICQILILQFIVIFWEFSQPRGIRFISSLLHIFRHKFRGILWRSFLPALSWKWAAKSTISETLPVWILNFCFFLVFI